MASLVCVYGRGLSRATREEALAYDDQLFSASATTTPPKSAPNFRAATYRMVLCVVCRSGNVDEHGQLGGGCSSSHSRPTHPQNGPVYLLIRTPVHMPMPVGYEHSIFLCSLCHFTVLGI
jgi:hypothetical protein